MSDAPSSAPSGTAKGEVTVQEPTRAQGLLARRAAESRATVPSYEATVEVDMTACVALREQAAPDARPTITALVVRACGLALREHPRVNGSYRDARFELHERVNVGVMVATDDGILAPTVVDADRTGLPAIGAQLAQLARRARDGSITPPELSGATFTVSNLGMHGVTRFGAVITPPQAAILAVGALGPRPVARDGAVVVRDVVDLTLACDHRIVYGVQAAAFLTRVRALLEEPASL